MILKSFEAFHGYGPKKKRVLIEQKMNFLPLLEQLPDDTDFSDVRQIDKWNAILCHYPPPPPAPFIPG